MWSLVFGVIAGLAMCWLALAVALWRAKPADLGPREIARLLPDLLRLIKRLATDPTMPKGVHIRIALLTGYLALPFDLIPDFIPVLGYADDALVVALVLRSVTRRAGPEALTEHWPGSPQGLDAVRRLCRLPVGD
ncbi:YkvA family protein [Mycolicibacterium hippocampi]|uniref:DUF1232 domain-containing protein n=1 Tax=Mycolicibacterium hippocampi TaxID=659824 RepID=A0A7I9ZL22_9MYCO|nr:DUF1232 domain-containing protein [Mycolicibacterium hippocampi]GFH01725.1 hypothetical protein MHIP_22080 [Mycolicibacterium hippocampi]